MESNLQKKLFKLTETNYKETQKKQELYIKALNVSRSAIYGRINGNIPITIDEADCLIRAFELNWEDLVGVPPPAENFAVTLPHSAETAPEEYMAALYDDILPLSGRENARTWHECGAIPIFLLKHSRLLASFKLYFWSKAFHPNHNGHTFPKFSARWAEEPRIKELLSKSKAALQAYQKIPGTEIWSRNMFDRTISCIQYILEMDGFAHADLVPQLLDEVRLVARQMERMAKAGNKSPEGTGREIEVYENRIFAPSNTLIGIGPDQQFLYIDLGYPYFIRYNSAGMVQERISQYQPMLRHMEPVIHSERARNLFIKGLEDQINHQMMVF